MIVAVRDGSVELYTYDTEHKVEGLSPARADIEDVVAALREALANIDDGAS
jgi:hypothetical protein